MEKEQTNEITNSENENGKTSDDVDSPDHSSEIRGLCSTKCSRETLQNLL